MAKKRKWDKRKPSRMRRRRLMATRLGPLLKIIVGLAIAAVMGVLLWVFVRPPLMEVISATSGEAKPTIEGPTPIPTPTLHPLRVLDKHQIQRDIDLGGSASNTEIRYATDPTRFGDRIYFAGGKDLNGDPKYNEIYYEDMITGERGNIENVILENEDIFGLQINEDWVVYLDHKRRGGGFIRAINQKLGSNVLMKEYYIGKPTITLSGNLVTWVERTGSYMDKVFLFDLVSKENVTLAMQTKSVFGQSDSDISADKVAWASVSNNITSASTVSRGQIAWVSLDDTVGGEISSFETGTHVFNPKTEGNAFAWIDQNAGPNPKLYFSLGNETPSLIAEGVSDFDLGSNFLAYCEEQVMHVYFWGNDSFSSEISLPGEKCIFGGVSQDTVFYYVTGGISKSDIIKYVAVNELSGGSAMYFRQFDVQPTENATFVPNETPRIGTPEPVYEVLPMPSSGN